MADERCPFSAEELRVFPRKRRNLHTRGYAGHRAGCSAIACWLAAGSGGQDVKLHIASPKCISMTARLKSFSKRISHHASDLYLLFRRRQESILREGVRDRGAPENTGTTS